MKINPNKILLAALAVASLFYLALMAFIRFVL